MLSPSVKPARRWPFYKPGSGPSPGTESTSTWILDLSLQNCGKSVSVAQDILSTVFCHNRPCRLIHRWNATVTQANRKWPYMKYTCIELTTGIYIPRYPGDVPTMDALGSGTDHALGSQRNLPRLHGLCWSCQLPNFLLYPSSLTWCSSDLVSNMPQA